jgi:hypothetical protein
LKVNLKIQISDKGLPEIMIGFDQDTAESEPYMKLTAHGFESVQEVIDVLGDVADSMRAAAETQPDGHQVRAEQEPGQPIGQFSEEGASLYNFLMSQRRPGETVLDAERRIRAEGFVAQKPRLPFNPQPRHGGQL